MIDSDGFLRCDNCGTVLGRDLKGTVEIVCHKSNCKRWHLFSSNSISISVGTTKFECSTIEYLTRSK